MVFATPVTCFSSEQNIDVPLWKVVHHGRPSYYAREHIPGFYPVGVNDHYDDIDHPLYRKDPGYIEHLVNGKYVMHVVENVVAPNGLHVTVDLTKIPLAWYASVPEQ